MDRSILYIIILALLITACKKDENDEDNQENGLPGWVLFEGEMSGHSGAALQISPDNSIIMAGMLNTNYQVYKTNFSFQQIWEVNKGLQAYEEANAVVVTGNNEYIVAGNSAFGFQSVMYAVRLDASGNTVWAKNYGWADINVCNGICRPQNNTYLLCGHTQDTKSRDAFGDVFAVRINGEGDTMWSRVYEDMGEETAYAVAATSDGGFVMTGRDENNNNKDLALIKIDGDGDLLWFRFFGGNTWEEGFYVIEDSDGNILACGISQGTASAQLYVIKASSNGSMIWERTHGSSDRSEKGYCIQETSGGYVISGTRYVVENVDDDIYLIKIDKNGNLLWEKVYGGSNSDYGNAVRVLPDGSLVVAGTTRSAGNGGKIYLLGTDANGEAK